MWVPTLKLPFPGVTLLFLLHVSVIHLNVPHGATDPAAERRSSVRQEPNDLRARSVSVLFVPQQSTPSVKRT